jgi:hypothetical protein
MVKNIRTFLLCAVGIFSVILSIKCFSIEDLNYETRSFYGGDAYTGIQNAAAITSKNVKELASIVQFGFGSLLLVNGLTLLAFGLTSPIQKKESEDTKTIGTSSAESTENAIEANETNEVTTE